jgi:hypothetical protein
MTKTTGRTTTRQKIEALTRRVGREMVDAFELAVAGVGQRDVARALDAGWLRYSSVSLAYWIVRPADPGALAVMRAAMSTDHGDEAA